MKSLIFLISFCFCINNNYTSYIQKCSEFYNIPSEIIYAIITVESDWRQNVHSKKNAWGLMQITPQCYNHYRRLNPVWSDKWITNFNIIKTDWKANINVGCWFLHRICYKEKKNWKEAITAYFWGINHTNTTDTYFIKVNSKIKKD